MVYNDRCFVDSPRKRRFSMYSVPCHTRRRGSTQLVLTQVIPLIRRQSLIRYCTGFLVLCSVIAFHVSLVRYVDDRYRQDSVPEATDRWGSSNGDPSRKIAKNGGKEIWGYSEEKEEEEEMDGRLKGETGRRLLSEKEEKAGVYPTKPVESDSEREVQNSQKQCRNGHIQGLNSVCDSLPCLRPLRPPQSVSSTIPRHDPVSPERLRQLNRIPGSFDTLHYTLIPFLTDMQWSSGIFGSVGEFGVSLGKFTALLTLNVDTEAGERIFVSDPFNCTASSFAGLSQYQIFSAHIRDFDFDEVSRSTPDRKIFVHHGQPSNAIKKLLLDWDLPRFRLISITSDRNIHALLLSLELAVCLLRDGGIIILDDNDSSRSLDVVHSTVTEFLSKNGHGAVVPFFAAGQKVFLTTTNWKREYTRLFRQKDTNSIHLSIVDNIYSAFGKDIFIVK